MPLTLRIGTGGSHEITGSLGAGAMGEVYRARDTKLKREVALRSSRIALPTIPVG